MAVKELARQGLTVEIPRPGNDLRVVRRPRREGDPAVEGVTAANVNLATERASVSFGSADADPQAVVEAIRDAGYEPMPATVELKVSGMTCASCVAPGREGAEARARRRRRRGQPGDRARHRAVLRLGGCGGPPRRGGRGDRLRGRGGPRRRRSHRRGARRPRGGDRGPCGRPSSSPPSSRFRSSRWRWDRTSCRACTSGSWTPSATGRAGTSSSPSPRSCCSVPACASSARAFRPCCAARPDMNSLVALGTAAAYGYSVVATFAPGVLPAGTANVYYEAAAVIVTLILLGRFLEARAKGRTSEAIKRLMGLPPKTARVVREGSVVEIPLAEVRAGDLVQVRPGEKVPVDGEVVEGSSYVDEFDDHGRARPGAEGRGRRGRRRHHQQDRQLHLPRDQGRRRHGAGADHPHGRGRPRAPSCRSRRSSTR